MVRVFAAVAQSVEQPTCNRQVEGSSPSRSPIKKEGERMLTANQEAFVQNVIQGMSQMDAYRSAYPNSKSSDKTIQEAASRLMKNSKVLARLTELRQELATPAIMSAQKRLEWLTGVIQSKDESTGDKLRAVDIMNKMQGEYVQKIQAEVQTETTINIELVDDDE